MTNVTELQYQQNELHRLFQRRGDLATMKDDIEAEHKQVVAAIALTRSRIAALAQAQANQPPGMVMDQAPDEGAEAERPKLRAVLAEEAARVAADVKP